MPKKYRFKEEHKDAQIAIPGVKTLITRFNLTDEWAERITKSFPKLAHNLELIPDGQSHDNYGHPEKINVPKRLQKFTTSELKPETKKTKTKKTDE